MVNIITIEREYGCGGGDIAQLVADRLSWKLWDQRLTEEIARLANCPKAVVEAREERNDPLYYRLFKSFLRGSYEGSSRRPSSTSSIARRFSKLRGVWLNTPPNAETASLWAGAPNNFSETDQILCVCFSMLQEKKKCVGYLLAAKARKKPKSSLTASIGNAPILSRSISMSNGQIVRFTTQW